MLVQGSTVSVMGPHKSLKEVRRIVLDCMKNIHPIYRIKVNHFTFDIDFPLKSYKELMIRRELAKDPKLATESWDRFLPNFRKNHLKTSEKTAKKNERLEAKNAARVAAGLPAESSSEVAAKKKVYTPFPPAQLPRKVRPNALAMLTFEYKLTDIIISFIQVDMQLESGEYFLKKHEKDARESAQRKQKVWLSDVLFMANITLPFFLL